MLEMVAVVLEVELLVVCNWALWMWLAEGRGGAKYIVKLKRVIFNSA